MEHIYEGFKITYIESSDKWRVLDNPDFEFGDFEHEKLSECKAWINRKLAADKKKEKEYFERRKALYHRFHGLEAVTVTSFAGHEYGRDQYWVTYADKRRGKVSGISEYDEELLNQWLNIEKQIQALSKVQNEIEGKLQPFKKA